MKGDGLFHSHEVGLWRGASLYWTWSELLNRVTIPSGTAAELDWRYRKLDLAASLTLEPGYYLLAGTYEWNQEDVVQFIHALDPPLQKDPRLEFGGPMFPVGGGSVCLITGSRYMA